MIGPEKLSTIRQQLRRALRATGEDPVAWLEKRMAASDRQGTVSPGGSDVLESLRRFLQGPQRQRRGKPRAGMKK